MLFKKSCAARQEFTGWGLGCNPRQKSAGWLVNSANLSSGRNQRVILGLRQWMDVINLREVKGRTTKKQSTDCKKPKRHELGFGLGF